VTLRPLRLCVEISRARKFSLPAGGFGSFIGIVKSRFFDSSIATWLIAVVLASWLLVGSGIELPFSWPQADADPAPARASEMKRGLQIDVRVFSLRFHVRLASLDQEPV
jgi:hypothetical protein